ncbi:hypothetical protein HMPREF1544_03835 [Mucor circinelloides 1006PhL]|uniref:DNA helicase n=1 Tax=Mucor circinelloides f. circinelloides (strain 1006PhL) TaxID=1220926 RepID=S2JG92_MUCC1|nr:hypothetical protein HMPREF1544_03835 [Mucor circinelloides 1006PhL]
MTNEWVVPYSPYLSKKYNAHINVKTCASVQAIKYINKYIYKGSDQTTLKTTTYQNYEVAKYLNGHYISPVEAAWRLFKFPMHEESPSVTIIEAKKKSFCALPPLQQEINKVKLNNHVKLYKKTILLLDECSMLTSAVVEGIFSGLMQATGRDVAFGGMAVVFFGDLGQLLPPKSKDYIWKYRLFLRGYKYSLTETMRHIEDEQFHEVGAFG